MENFRLPERWVKLIRLTAEGKLEPDLKKLLQAEKAIQKKLSQVIIWHQGNPFNQAYENAMKQQQKLLEHCRILIDYCRRTDNTREGKWRKEFYRIGSKVDDIGENNMSMKIMKVKASDVDQQELLKFEKTLAGYGKEFRSGSFTVVVRFFLEGNKPTVEAGVTLDGNISLLNGNVSAARSALKNAAGVSNILAEAVNYIEKKLPAVRQELKEIL